MQFIRLSGKRIPLPLRRRGSFKNRKFDLVVLVLLLLAVLYGGTAFAMQNLLPFAPIASDSMEPAISQGDLALVKRVEALEIQEGDVIVFTIPPEIRPTGYPAIRLAHRIVRVEQDPAVGLVFWTKGDALEAMDPFGTPSRLVHGKVVYSVPKLGYVWLFFQSKQGHTFLVLVAILLVIYRVEKPLRTWGSAIATGKITDPQLLETIKMLEESRVEDRVILSAFTEQMAVHLGVLGNIGEATKEFTQAVRRSRTSFRRRRRKKRRKKGKP